jgi:hypothetical protein
MRKQVLCLLFSMLAVCAHAQYSYQASVANVEAEQNAFRKFVLESGLQADIKPALLRFSRLTIDSMQKALAADTISSEAKKAIASQSMALFLKRIRADLKAKRYEVFFVPDAMQKYSLIWHDLQHNGNWKQHFTGFGIPRTEIMLLAFGDFPQYAEIKDIAMLKKLQRDPEKIASYAIENRDFPYIDTLAFMVANEHPEIIVHLFEQSSKKEAQQYLLSHQHPLVKMVATLSLQPNKKNYMPFAYKLLRGEITKEKIDKLRQTPSAYFAAMVDEVLQLRAEYLAGKKVYYTAALRYYISKYAVDFYVSQMNQLHEQTDKQRFFSLEGLRPEDLYFIIVGGDAAFYTSSYLFTYNKLMSFYQKKNAHELFASVNNTVFRKFIQTAIYYNNFRSLLNNMPADTAGVLLKKFVTGIESSADYKLSEAMDVAEAIPGIMDNAQLSQELDLLLRSNKAACRKNGNYYGTYVYGLLQQIYQTVADDKAGKSTKVLTPYLHLSRKEVEQSNQQVIQQVFFYGDEDGRASFDNFMSGFRDTKQWKQEQNGLWITLRSLTGAPVVVYANLPLNNDEGKDLMAIDSLGHFLRQQKIEPHILIHRGHSYHVEHTIDHITKATRLAILGSCGGHKNLSEVIYRSPDAQVIATKQIGSKLVNEPLLRMFNDAMRNGVGVDWKPFWLELGKRLSRDPKAAGYFKDYIPPYQNMGILLLRLHQLDETS